MDKQIETINEYYKNRTAKELLQDLVAGMEKGQPKEPKSPDEKEYNAYLKNLFVEHIQPNIEKGLVFFQQKIPQKIPSMAYEDVMYQLKRALGVIRFIETCETDEEIYNTFKPQKLKQILIDIRNVLMVIQEVTETTGFKDANDESYMLITPMMHSSDLPKEDMELLKEMRVDNPEEYVDGMLFKVKHTIQDASNGKGIMIKNEMLGVPSMTDAIFSSAISKINSKIELMSQPRIKKEKMPKKKWWSATGTIIRGTGLVIGNIVLGITSNSTELLSATIPSTCTGLGIIVEGIGKIKDDQ